MIFASRLRYKYLALLVIVAMTRPAAAVTFDDRGPDPRTERVVRPGKVIKVPEDGSPNVPVGNNTTGQFPVGNSNTSNIALNKPARQSSLSQWSTGPNDAQGGNDGKKSGEVQYGFHTNGEQNPWWQVDLEKNYWLGDIRIYNRRDFPWRVKTLQVLVSKDGMNWTRVYTHDGTTFGADGKPLVVYPKTGMEGYRYVRVQLNENEQLHLEEVEVYELNYLFNRPGENTIPPVVGNVDICNDPRTKALLGTWCALGDARTRCTIECAGGKLVFLNELGERPTGRFESANSQVVLTTDAFGEAVKVTPSADGKRLNWSNGVFWVRCTDTTTPPPIVPPVVLPRVEPKIEGVSHDARTALKAGDTLRITVRGTPGMNATFDLPPLIKGQELRETRPGEYSGTYTVNPGDNVQNGSITAYLKGGGDEDFLQGRDKVTIGTALPLSTGVDGATVRLGKTQYAPGEEVKFDFTAPATFPATAWVGLIPSNVPHGSEEENDRHDIAYHYLRQNTTGTLTFKAPMVPWGSYDVRMNNSLGKEVASATFTVGVAGMTPGATRLGLDKGNFAPNEEFRVHFTTPGTYADSAWVGVIPSNIPHGDENVNDQYDSSYAYVRRYNSGTVILRAPGTPGNYDARLNDSSENGKETASISFTVGGNGGNTPILSSTATTSGSNPTGRRYTLARIEVTTTYGPGDWLPPLAQNRGAKTYRPDQRTFPLGWEFRWPAETNANNNRAMSTITLTEVPATINEGGNATFAASMKGDYNTTGYGVERRYLLRLEGAAGDKEWTKYLPLPNGVHAGELTATKTGPVPKPVGNQIIVPMKALIRFGDDHKGDMEIRFVYEAGG